MNSVDHGDEHHVWCEQTACGRAACRRNIGFAGARGKLVSDESTYRTTVNRKGATVPAGRARKRHPAPVRAERSGQLVTRSAWYRYYRSRSRGVIYVACIYRGSERDTVAKRCDQ